MSNNNNNNNNSDPNGLLHSVVKIANTAREDMNGKIGTAMDYDAGRGRYMVHVLNNANAPPQVLALKPENLVAATMAEKARQRFAELKFYYSQATNDPRVRQQFRQAYDGVQRSLPPRIKPEYLLAALGLGLVSSVWFFGLSKTFLGLSLFAMLLLVSAPDVASQLQSGRLDLASVARNFPSRWHAMLVQATGFTRISRRVALGLFVLFMLMSGKVLLTPTPKATAARPVPPTPPVNGGDDVGTATDAAVDGTRPVNTVATAAHGDAYRAGFDDATAGRPFGHSLPAVSSATGSSPYVDRSDDELRWSHDPPPRPPPTKKSPFDVTTAMAAFTLFRTGKQLGTGPDGRFNAELLVANARNMDPMRMGFTGLALYRIVSRFLF